LRRSSPSLRLANLRRSLQPLRRRPQRYKQRRIIRRRRVTMARQHALLVPLPSFRRACHRRRWRAESFSRRRRGPTERKCTRLIGPTERQRQRRHRCCGTTQRQRDQSPHRRRGTTQRQRDQSTHRRRGATEQQDQRLHRRIVSSRRWSAPRCARRSTPTWYIL
jgi:hypothetical protein